MSFVPLELTGVWRRELITAPGFRDEATQVYWLQTRSWYADLRVPADRPVARARSLDAYGKEDLARLALVQGFAGELTASADVCLWRRDLDFQPPGPIPDEGTYEIVGDVMIERGVHAEYEEIWRKVPGSDGPAAAFELTGDSAAPGRRGLLVVAGDHFMCVLDRVSGPPQGASLSAVAAEPGFDRTVFDMPICYGRVSGGWNVELASLPWLEGAPLWGNGVARFDEGGARLNWSFPEGERVFRLLDASAAEPEGLAALLQLDGVPA